MNNFMKKGYFLIFIIIVPLLSISQSVPHLPKIKMDKSGNEIKYTASSFGLQLGIGASFNYYDQETVKYFGNHKGSTYKLSFFYTNFSLGFAFKPIHGSITEQTDTIYFNLDNLPESMSLYYYRTDITIGYTFDLPYNFSAEPSIGFLNTGFEIEDQNGVKIESVSKNVFGITTGVTLNKYIRVGGISEYLVFYVNGNINYSNYSKIHPLLGNSFYSVEVGVAVKSWFVKKTKQ